jgi:hypothetical protein
MSTSLSSIVKKCLYLSRVVCCKEMPIFYQELETITQEVSHCLSRVKTAAAGRKGGGQQEEVVLFY